MKFPKTMIGVYWVLALINFALAIYEKSFINVTLGVTQILVAVLFTNIVTLNKTIKLLEDN